VGLVAPVLPHGRKAQRSSPPKDGGTREGCNGSFDVLTEQLLDERTVGDVPPSATNPVHGLISFV
jgi:hypothetical protein